MHPPDSLGLQVAVSEAPSQSAFELELLRVGAPDTALRLRYSTKTFDTALRLAAPDTALRLAPDTALRLTNQSSDEYIQGLLLLERFHRT
jgi:hypothetical protein